MDLNLFDLDVKEIDSAKLCLTILKENFEYRNFFKDLKKNPSLFGLGVTDFGNIKH